MSLKQYETVFILTPVLSDQQMKDTALKFKQILLDQGAKIVNEESWGLRKLAYTIDHKNTGFYHLLQFEADPQVIKTLHWINMPLHTAKREKMVSSKNQ